jgi:hypothetical protein
LLFLGRAAVNVIRSESTVQVLDHLLW